MPFVSAPRRRRVALLGASVALIVGLVVLVSALGFDLTTRVWGDDGPQPVPIAEADLGGTGPGTLVSAVTMPAFIEDSVFRDLQAARVVYRSTNGDTGAATEVSGAVFTPNGTPPPGGWPVVALAHGTTGLDEDCAPSKSRNLWGLAEPVAGFIKSGYAVALADYQGLGAPGLHPYTDSRTAGLNVIDSVRALRHTYPGVSTRWLAFGGSQGGGASWAADEQAAPYAPDLELVGAVANSPVADLTGLVDKANRGTLTDDQLITYLLAVESIARLHPEVVRDDYRGGGAAEHWDLMVSCDPDTGEDRTAMKGELEAKDFAPHTPGAAKRLRTVLANWALPQRPLSAPLSVTYGGEDDVIDAQWTTDAIARACALGGVVVWDLQRSQGHGDVDITRQFRWLADRFAGAAVVNQCPAVSPAA